MSLFTKKAPPPQILILRHLKCPDCGHTDQDCREAGEAWWGVYCIKCSLEGVLMKVTSTRRVNE